MIRFGASVVYVADRSPQVAGRGGTARVLCAAVPPLLLTRAPTAADARPAAPAAALSFRFPTFRLPLLPPPPATTAGAVAVAPTAATNDDEAEVSGGPSARFPWSPRRLRLQLRRRQQEGSESVL